MDQQRKNRINRFLFANGVSLLTLLSVAFSAGSFWSKVEATDEKRGDQLDRIEQKVKQTDARVDKMVDELTLIKLKAAGYDVDLDHIKRRYNGTDAREFTRGR